jgi:YHS domain-containing protein
MKYPRFYCTVFATMILMSACKIKGDGRDIVSTPKPEHSTGIKVTQLALKTDPICMMPLKDGEIEDTTMYQGKLYGFCNIGCKTEFLKEPAKYLTQQ